ncbi:MAG: ribonuclease D [Marinobacter sp. 34-60-7]|nr:MAG: ribonuclease D [Marinobacter sp. 34-60-7]
MTDTEQAVTAPPAPATIRWFETPGELDAWLKERPQDQPLVLDTEFERVSTFYPIPGLVQLGAGEDFFLIDPSVAEQSHEFARTLADPQRPKLLYAMSEDLELFRHWLDVPLRGVVDLQIGAALAGAGFSVGYAPLVETLFGETLDKGATRSDWLSRPLTEAQQRYALDDIRFLEPLYGWVVKRVAQRDLLDALAEEPQRFADELASTPDPEQHYLKIRGGWALTREQQGVLQALAAWRERECARLDRPRNRVLNDALLIAIAERLPGSLGALSGVEGIHGGQVKRHGQVLLDLVRSGRDADHSRLEPIPRPLTREQQALYKRVKRSVNGVAEQWDVPMELLAPRKRLERVIQAGTLAGDTFFTGWRARLLQPVVSDIEELLQP